MNCPICKTGMAILSSNDKVTVYMCCNPKCKYQVVEKKD